MILTLGDRITVSARPRLHSLCCMCSALGDYMVFAAPPEKEEEVN
jgi:hypothetical protein